MRKEIPLKKYQRKMEHSYALGAFPTIELLQHKPEKVIRVLIHPDMNSESQFQVISKLCEKYGIPYEINRKDVEKIRDKENCLSIGVFEKYDEDLKGTPGHIVLVNPSDMGNMGTIIRTAIGFGIRDLAIIEPAVDIFNPKVVRSSMGALFQMRFHRYCEFEQYAEEFPDRSCYPFMLKGAMDLQEFKPDKHKEFSLIFGNEATGLPDEYALKGQSIRIRHQDTIDSLNLSMAVGIALYEFTK
ncbi:MAG: TrmH family RNA methyltransferase [Lachnospiraceae bacterium]